METQKTNYVLQAQPKTYPAFNPEKPESDWLGLGIAALGVATADPVALYLMSKIPQLSIQSQQTTAGIIEIGVGAVLTKYGNRVSERLVDYGAGVLLAGVATFIQEVLHTAGITHEIAGQLVDTVPPEIKSAIANLDNRLGALEGRH